MEKTTENTLKEINRGQNGQPIFEAGKSYTVFTCNGMAMTCKQQIIVTRFDDEGNPIYKEKGKRKEFILRLKTMAYVSAPEKMFSGAVFEGLEQPYTCDTDGGTCFRGNACFNFVGDVEGIRQWIMNGNRNPWFDLSTVLAVSKTLDGTETPCFADLYQGGHAVIDRILNKMGVSK